MPYKPLAKPDTDHNDPRLGDPISEVLGQGAGSAWHTPIIGRYHASQLPSCLRKQWYGFQPANQAPITERSDSSNKSLWLGTVFHDQLTDYILPRVQDTFTLIDAEKPIYQHVQTAGQEALIVGKYDAIIQKPSGQYAILEIKTTKNLSYVAARREPQDHHKLQAAIYMHATNIPRTVFLYWSWKELDHLFLETNYKENDWDKMRAAALMLHSHLKSGEEPPAIPNYDWEGRFCPYRDICGGCGLEAEYDRNVKK